MIKFHGAGTILNSKIIRLTKIVAPTINTAAIKKASKSRLIRFMSLDYFREKMMAINTNIIKNRMIHNATYHTAPMNKRYTK